MELNTYLQVLKNRKGKVLSWLLAFIAIAALISFSQPLKYEASSRILVIQEGTSADPYTIAKSNQYISSLLAEAVRSGSFFEMLSSSGQNIDRSYFRGDYKQQLKTWKKTVEARSLNDTGVMEINVYHPDTTQAYQISLAVNNLLASQNSYYQSASDNVKIKVIDQPTISSLPTKPDLVLNFGAAIIFGLIFGLAYVYYFPENRRKTVKQEIRRPQTAERHIAHEAKPASHPAQGNFENKPSFQGNIRNVIR